jgi:SAM-dependent methyltransferase
MEASSVKVKHPDLDARELAIEMRTATELSRADAGGTLSSIDVSPELHLRQHSPAQLPQISDLASRPAFEPGDNDQYEVASFMQLYDVDFVEALYRAILKREPDPAGVGFYLEGLRSGTLERVDVIVAMLDSAEGKRHNVRVSGLTLPRLMRGLTSLPLIGYPIRLGLDLLRLPVLIRRLHHSIASTAQLAHARNQQIVDHLNTTHRLTTDYVEGLSASVAELGESSETLSERLETNRVEQRAQADELNSRLTLVAEAHSERHDALSTQVSALANELNSRLVSMMDSSEAQVRETTTQIQQIRDRHADLTRYSETEIAKLLTHAQQLRRELSLQRAVFAMLEESNQPSIKRDEMAASTAEAHRSLDAVYVELEDRFRGSRDDVKNSQTFYLPSVQAAPNRDRPIVDLGSGRGEWLELLREAGVDAIGVETNRVMIDLCRERGLEVIEQDALSYLRGLPDECLRAVTGFHIIEHLPPETLMLLLDQIMRTLRTGGFVAFETPNPDNLFVSGNYFYFDPSHHHPLPSKLVKLFLESSGFQDVAVTPLHPCAEGRFVKNDDVSKRLNDLFYGPMDYAIVGWKLDR